MTGVADPEGSARSTAIDTRLRRYGGDRLSVENISIDGSESAAMKRATLSGTLNGSAFNERIWLSRRAGRWYVKLGPSRNANPHKTQSSTRPTNGR